MKPLSQLILHDACLHHLATLRRANNGVLFDAFLHWLLPQHFVEPVSGDLVKSAGSKRGGARSYRDVALLGYTGPLVVELGLTQECNELTRWIVGTSILTSSGFDPIVDDPVGLLGVWLAMHGADETLEGESKSWMSAVCQESIKDNVRPYNVAVFKIIDSTLDNQLSELDCPPDALTALQGKGIMKIDRRIYQEAFRLAKQPAVDNDLLTSSLRLAALDWLNLQSSVSLSTMSVEQVSNLLSGVQGALLRWVWEQTPRTGGKNSVARKWYVENEYHFQSLLYTILRPMFSDLKEEEFTPSVGSTQPRADLYIPSLKLVIEVKFWYRNNKSRKLINELAADASLYRTKRSEIQSVIPIIWDDGMRTQEHQIIKDGLAEMDGLLEAVFVNRPSTMV